MNIEDEQNRKVYKLLLKHILVKYDIKDIIRAYTYNTTEIDNLALLQAISDLVEEETSFLYLSDVVTSKMSKVGQIVYENISLSTDTLIRDIPNTRDMQNIYETLEHQKKVMLDTISMLKNIKKGFVSFHNKSPEEKEVIKRNYLKENYKIRTGSNEYYNEITRIDNKMVIEKLAWANRLAQAYDYTFYLSAQEENFDNVIREKQYLEFIFSLNYLLGEMPQLFIPDRKELFLDTLKEIEKKNKDTKQYVKYARNHLEKNY